MEQQLSLFGEVYSKYLINKRMRLIELFAGIGAQYKAFKLLTDNVENYKTCEWAYNSIIAYNAIHHQDNTNYAEGLTRKQLLDYLNGNISIDYNNHNGGIGYMSVADEEDMSEEIISFIENYLKVSRRKEEEIKYQQLSIFDFNY